MKEELNKTIEILKKQNNNIIYEINSNKNDIEKNTELIKNLVKKFIRLFYPTGKIRTVSNSIKYIL